MPHKCPDFVTFCLGAFASVFGMLARWFENKMFGKSFNFFVFAFDLCMSAVAGVGVYWLVFDLGQPDSVCAMSAAVTGNIGSRVFDIARIVFRKRTGIEVPENKEQK